MSLIRSADFPGFDESLHRLQDWDLYLTLLAQGKRGVYCNDIIFTTKVRDGITHNGPVDILEAERRIKEKHDLPILTFKVDESRT
jgi:hypothetical protein